MLGLGVSPDPAPPAICATCGASVVTADGVVSCRTEDPMKFSDTQLIVLSAAAQREDRIALPLPWRTFHGSPCGRREGAHRRGPAAAVGAGSPSSAARARRPAADREWPARSGA